MSGVLASSRGPPVSFLGSDGLDCRSFEDDGISDSLVEILRDSVGMSSIIWNYPVISGPD